MASLQNPKPRIPANRTQKHLLVFKYKLLIFWALSVLVLLLALSSNIKNFRYYRLQYLRSTLSNTVRSSFINTILGFSSNQRESSLPPIYKNPNCLLWMAPFLSGGGYSSEAWSYITALDQIRENPFRLKIFQHGDQETLEFWDGLDEKSKALGYRLYNTDCRINETIVICHSEPGAWYPPLFDTFPCPPTGYEEPLFVIGRTMFETDRLNPEHVKRCNRMDSVWVPTDFQVSAFTQSGVEPSKLVKMVQPIDVDFFDPSKFQPMDHVVKKLVLGSKSHLNLNSLNKKNKSRLNSDLLPKSQFVFLSVFKWELRKGWDLLLKSYLKEFSATDGVVLYLLISSYHSDSNFRNKILTFVESSGLEEPDSGWAPVYVIDKHIAQIDLPRIYRAADAFVLPSRGEGWGRPIVEAMSMSLPVISTNWSGPTEYLTEENGYPIPVDRMSKVMEGPFRDHFWAEASVEKLRFLMRHVLDNPEEARMKGRKAREDMIRRFSPQIVARLVSDQILQIFKNKTV